MYNWWTADETTNESGELPEIYESALDIDDIKEMNALEPPRYVVISFDEPPAPTYSTPEQIMTLKGLDIDMDMTHTDLGSGHSMQTAGDQAIVSSIWESIESLESEHSKGNIMTEESLTNSVFSGVSFQPTTLVSDLYSLFSGSLEVISSLSVEDTDIDTDMGSRQDNVKDFTSGLESSGLTSETKSLLIKSLFNYQNEGYSTAIESDSISNAFNNIASHMSMNCSINSLVICDVIDKSAESGGNFLYNAARDAWSIAKSIQDSFIESTTAGVIDISEYYASTDGASPAYITAVSHSSAGWTQAVKEAAVCLGYMIERRRLNTDGTVTNLDTIFIDSASSTRAVDYAVMYGHRYQYKIRAVYLTRFHAVNVYDDDSESRYAYAGVLIASRGTSWLTELCSESDGPPAPIDFYFEIDDNDTGLDIAWSFPHNPSMDIMKFQIFRRSSTSDPFKLIKQINFSPSEASDISYETIPESLNDRMDHPLCVHNDDDWTRESSYIYAVCSIDAHGLTSGYSSQYRVSFDYFSGGLVVDRISKSGAPKPYPNIYLEGDTFVDTIKDSGHTKFSLYFDPEYLYVTDEAGNSLDFLTPDSTSLYETSEDIDKLTTSPSYKMQIINIDMQKASIFNIYLSDSASVIDTIK